MIQGIIEFFHSGGVFMIPLGLCSVAGVTFILERGFALRREKVIPKLLYDASFYFPVGQSTDGLAEMVAKSNSALSRLLRICLEHLPYSKSENIESLQTRARTEAVKLDRGLVVLEIIVGIGPLLGLLGTISGLINIFGGIGAQDLSSQGLVIAKGIAEALNSTVMGLVVAIPALIAHSYYTKKVENMMIEMEGVCMDLLYKLYLEAPAAESSPK